jgi:hypothetical protein
MARPTKLPARPRPLSENRPPTEEPANKVRHDGYHPTVFVGKPERPGQAAIAGRIAENPEMLARLKAGFEKFLGRKGKT